MNSQLAQTVNRFLPSKNYQVFKLHRHGAPARVAFDAAFGDLRNGISKTMQTVNWSELDSRIAADGLLGDANAYAFIRTFDLYRWQLMVFKEAGVFVDRRLKCLPKGASLRPSWPVSRWCDHYLCPFCRYRRAYVVATSGFAELTAPMHWYFCVRDSDTMDQMNTVIDRVDCVRKDVTQYTEMPKLKFNRAGLDVNMEQKDVYRFMQAVVAAEPIAGLESPRAIKIGFIHEQRSFADCIALGLRYSSSNLLNKTGMDLELTKLRRLRAYDFSK